MDKPKKEATRKATCKQKKQHRSLQPQSHARVCVRTYGMCVCVCIFSNRCGEKHKETQKEGDKRASITSGDIHRCHPVGAYCERAASSKLSGSLKMCPYVRL